MKVLVLNLAAVLIILLCLRAKSRLNQWTEAWRDYDSDISRLQQVNAQNSGLINQPWTSAEEATERAQLSKRNLEQAEGNNRQLEVLLQQKPFGLPLSTDEEKALASARRAARDFKEQGRKVAQQIEWARRMRELKRNPIPTAPPRPGDWMWNDRTGTTLERPQGL